MHRLFGHISRRYDLWYIHQNESSSLFESRTVAQICSFGDIECVSILSRIIGVSERILYYEK